MRQFQNYSMYSVISQREIPPDLFRVKECMLLPCLFLDHSLNVNPIYVVMHTESDSGHDYTGVHTE